MNTQRPLFYLFQYLSPFKSKVILATISSVLNKLCDIVPEILIGIAIDVIVNKDHSIIARFVGIVNPYHQLYWVAGLTALLWILESAFEYCYLRLWRGIAQDVQHSLRLQLYSHVQSLDVTYFEDKTTGGLLSIINNDVNELEQFLTEAPNAIIQLLINIIVMGAIFTYLSPLLAVLTLLPIPFVVIMAYFFQYRLATLYAIVRDRAESLASHIAGRLSGITTIKSYTAEEFELACLVQESNAYKAANYSASKINAAYIPLVRMGILVGFIMSMVVGGWYALQGILAISSYSVLVFLTQRFLWPFTTLTTITDMYEKAMASVRRIQKVLTVQTQIKEGSKQLIVKDVEGTIAFKDVSFAYKNGVQIFENLSFTIQPKKTVAFVGTTGSGKSTIIKLLLRFYDPTKGIITLDGTNIGAVTLHSLRSANGLVSQDVYLINGTIAENIAYGLAEVSTEEIIKAAKMGQAHEFIMQLPNGYNTIIGENGKNLSGGQRQRISIARAILKNPPVFIFDEATSALDNETEAAIQRSMNSLAHNHTMIIIAHRLSIVRNADTIFVLEKGEIIEQGTHNELLAEKGAYARLWEIQTGG